MEYPKNDNAVVCAFDGESTDWITEIVAGSVAFFFGEAGDTSGDIIVRGTYNGMPAIKTMGIALSPAKHGEQVAVAFTGVVEATSDGGGAIVPGDSVFIYQDALGRLRTVNGANRIGIAMTYAPAVAGAKFKMQIAIILQ